MTQVRDILGDEAAAAGPDQMRSVATRLADIATTAAAIGGNLSSLDSAHWTGTAADNYREKQNNQLPHELSRIDDSFGIASSALNTYAAGLDDVLGQARALAAQYDAATESLANAHRSEHLAAQTLRQARAERAAAADPVAIAHAQAAVATAARGFSMAIANRESAEDAIARLDRRSQALREQLQADAAACAAQLHDASAAGIQNNLFSWADRNIVDGVPGAIVSEVAGAVSNFAVKTVELGAAAVEFELDPSLAHLDQVAKAYSDWVDAAKPIVEAVAVCAMVVAAVVIVACAPETIAAVVPAMSAIGEATTAIGIGLDATKTGADGYLFFRGEVSGDTVVNDVIDTGIDVATAKLDPGTDSQVEDLKSSLDTYERTGTSQAEGWVTKRVTAVQLAELKSLVVNGGSTAVQALKDAFLPDIERGVHSLLGQAIAPQPAPVVGPFTSITQGPTARVRVQLAGAPVLAGAVA